MEKTGKDELRAYLMGIVSNLPDCPGCYQYLDETGTIIYVGKAKDLRRRVSSYFRPGARHAPKVRSMVDTVFDFEWMTVKNDAEALLCNNEFSQCILYL